MEYMQRRPLAATAEVQKNLTSIYKHQNILKIIYLTIYRKQDGSCL